MKELKYLKNLSIIKFKNNSLDITKFRFFFKIKSKYKFKLYDYFSSISFKTYRKYFFADFKYFEFIKDRVFVSNFKDLLKLNDLLKDNNILLLACEEKGYFLNNVYLKNIVKFFDFYDKNYLFVMNFLLFFVNEYNKVVVFLKTTFCGRILNIISLKNKKLSNLLNVN